MMLSRSFDFLCLGLLLSSSNAFVSPLQQRRPVLGSTTTTTTTTTTALNGVSTNLNRHQTKRRRNNDTMEQAEEEKSSPLQTVGGDDTFLTTFYHANSECDDVNTPPSLNILKRALRQLPNGSDIRGTFVDHSRVGSIMNVAHSIGTASQTTTGGPLTPLSAHCLGHGFARWVLQQKQQQEQDTNNDDDIKICIGQDPRPHGRILADAFCRGVSTVAGCEACYTGIATTPAMSYFVRSGLCDASVMVTASHLPVDRNGMKFFISTSDAAAAATTTTDSDMSMGAVTGLTKDDIQQVVEFAESELHKWFTLGILPPTSGADGVYGKHVDSMPLYETQLQNALWREVDKDDTTPSNSYLPLNGLKIVLNAGNGSGGFFARVLEEMGANVDWSMNINPDPTFPQGVPNPEYAAMLEPTLKQCQDVGADLGIMLDTDADRSGFIVPVNNANGEREYQVLNRNRLIALMGVIFASASTKDGDVGANHCAVVTDSCTSEGLERFLEGDLGLQHVRYLKGYANVIAKAKELQAEVAIETSGHCALRENGYLDDGTYTAVKVIGLLARLKQQDQDSNSVTDDSRIGLLDLISNLQEMPVVQEVRLKVKDGSVESTKIVFDFCAMEIERASCGAMMDGDVGDDASSSISIEEEECDITMAWQKDPKNLEGIRVRLMMSGPGSFFMLRKSLHDPIISLQVEGMSREDLRETVMTPLINLFSSDATVANALDLTPLREF